MESRKEGQRPADSPDQKVTNSTRLRLPPSPTRDTTHQTAARRWPRIELACKVHLLLGKAYSRSDLTSVREHSSRHLSMACRTVGFEEGVRTDRRYASAAKAFVRVEGVRIA